MNRSIQGRMHRVVAAGFYSFLARSQEAFRLGGVKSNAATRRRIHWEHPLLPTHYLLFRSIDTVFPKAKVREFKSESCTEITKARGVWNQPGIPLRTRFRATTKTQILLSHSQTALGKASKQAGRHFLEHYYTSISFTLTERPRKWAGGAFKGQEPACLSAFLP